MPSLQLIPVNGNVTDKAKDVLKFFAYGVTRLHHREPAYSYCRPNPNDNTAVIVDGCGYIHYWIDDKLQYHECVKDTGSIPECTFIEEGWSNVELRGPGNYTIKTTPYR